MRKLTHNLPNKAPLILCLLILLGAAALWLWGFNTTSFVHRDAFDYAQISRELQRGHSLDTLQAFPRHLPFLAERGYLQSGHWPNLSRNSLMMIVSLFFQLFFESVITSAIMQSGFWYLASALLLFFLAKRLTNSRVAIVSTAFYLADATIFHYSYSGMTETLATFLLLAVLIVAIGKEMAPWKWMLLGALSGLSYLARTQWIILIPLILFYVWMAAPKPRRLLASLLVIAGLLIPLTPWMVRNWRVAGDPLFSFTTSRNLVLDAIPSPSDLDMQTGAPLDVGVILRQHGQAILAKFFRNVRQNIFSAPYWANSLRGMLILFPLLYFAALLKREELEPKSFTALKWGSLILLAATFLLISLTVYSVRSYLMFRPLILLIGAEEGDRLLRRMIRAPQLLIAATILLTIVGIAQFASLVVGHKNAPPPLSKFDRRAFDILERVIPADALIATDNSEQISLFTSRHTLRLPAHPEELFEIDQKYLSVDYVLLSKELWTGTDADPNEPNYHETYEAYVEFAQSDPFLQRYTLKERLPNGAVLFERREEVDR